MKNIITLIVVLLTSIISAQEIQYVNADNGLIIRSAPNKKSKRIGKLNYGTQILITKQTGIKISIIDNGKNINGEWVAIEGTNTNIKGYVFNGYLTLKKPNNPLKINFEDFALEMKLDIWDKNKILEKVQKDSAIVFVELGDSPEGKQLKITSLKNKKIELFQRYENSITIMNEGPHCDLKEWKHYYSDWEKLLYNNSSNAFLTKTYTKENREQFIAIDINNLKQIVKERCGESWYKLVENIKSVNEYPYGITTSRIFLKLIITHKNNSITEKIIVFEIPMGC